MSTPRQITNLVLKAVALAMGVAVVVMSILGNLTPADGLMLLGLGLAALAITQFQK
jgi:hypothetical protein